MCRDNPDCRLRDWSDSMVKLMFKLMWEFVRRNPGFCFGAIVLSVLIVIFAPALAIVILALLGIAAIFVGIGAWKIYKVQRDLKRRFTSQFGGMYEQADGGKSNKSSQSGGQKSQKAGPTRVTITPDAPRQKVNDRVGDYVDFEEVKN